MHRAFHRARVGIVTAMLTAAVAVSSLPHRALAQETIAGEVWLGSTLFTIEDLENFADAAKLNADQKEAAAELMRGAMARARTMSLKTYRDMGIFEDQDETPEASAKKMEDWQEKQKKQAREVVEIEKSVMNDLKALLEPAQIEEGWPKFERARRRLLLRSIEDVQRTMTMMKQRDGLQPGMPYMEDETNTIPDLVATVRASKLSDSDFNALSTILEQYAKNLDGLITEYRAAAKPILSPRMFAAYSSEMKFSDEDATRTKDAIKRMRQTHVRFAKQVDEALKGDARDRFMRQRLRAEFMWEWQPSKRQPQVLAIQRIRSLSKEQKESIARAIKDADTKLLRLAADSLRQRDEKVLQDREQDKKPWEYMNDPESQERMKKEQKLRAQLIKDLVALLNDKQKTAYETGIENDQDLADAFEKRRHGKQSWGIDQDLMGWDAYNNQNDEEEEPKK